MNTLIIVLLVLILIYMVCPDCITCLSKKAGGLVCSGQEKFDQPWEMTGIGIAPNLLATNRRDHILTGRCTNSSTNYPTTTNRPCSWGYFNPGCQ